MKLAGRLVSLGAALAALTLPLFGGAPCAIITPEPSTFLLIGGGGAAILVLRHLRNRKK